MVNHTWLPLPAAVPTALLALEVQRGGMPGAPGGVIDYSPWLAFNPLPVSPLTSTVASRARHAKRYGAGAWPCPASV